MSADTTLNMKVRSGDGGGGGGDMSPTSNYPTGSMVRSRPKLPQMEPRSTTLSPERKAGIGAAGAVPEEGLNEEDLERDLDSLRNTDFTSKYSRRNRASGTTSPTGSSRAMSPTHPGGGQANIRRIESLRMRLVKVKESQDRAEQAGRDLRLMRGCTLTREKRSPPLIMKKIRHRTRDSQSADSSSSSRHDSPDKHEDTGDINPAGSTAVPPAGSVPLTPSVKPKHAGRARSEPISSTRRDSDDEDGSEPSPIRWIQGNSNIESTGGVREGDLKSPRLTHHGPAQSQDSDECKKTITFSNSHNESFEDSTPSETQSKTSSTSTLKDPYESDDERLKVLAAHRSHTRPKIPGLEQLVGSQREGGDNSHVITYRDPQLNYETDLNSSAFIHTDVSDRVSSAAEEEEEEEEGSSDDAKGHTDRRDTPLTRIAQGNKTSLSRTAAGCEGEEGGGEGEGAGNEREEQNWLHEYIPNQGVHTQQIPQGAPSTDGAAAAGAVGGEGRPVRRPGIGGITPVIGKMPNGRSPAHPPGPGHGHSSVDSNGFAALLPAHAPPAAPPGREPTSQVRPGSGDSPRVSMVMTSPEQTTHHNEAGHDDVMVDANNELDKFERRNGKSLKQKSKSDPSGEKRRENHSVMTSHAQSTSELDKTEQGRVFLSTQLAEDALPKSDEITIYGSFESKLDSDTAIPAASRFPRIRMRSMKPSSGESAPVQQEPSTAPSSPKLPTINTTPPSRPTPGINRVTRSKSTVGPASCVPRRPKDLDIRPRPALPGDVFMGQQRFPDRSTYGSTLSLMETPAKEKRELIVEELVETEQQYVETLQRLVDTYMIPMKTQGILDSKLVDDIFYKINEISTHHAMFLAFLEGALQRWDNSSSTIGDVIQTTFQRETVIENYTSFIENFPRAEKVLDELINKSTFHKFLEQCELQTRNKLPLKAQIVKPAQRIPRYELLLRRLIENTPRDHPDYELLLRAEGAIHEVALRINSVKESKHEESLQETLRTLEFLLVTDLVAPERLYHRHDMVQVLSRKDQCCMWLFSDLAVLTCIKRKSGPVNRRSTLLLKSPSGQDFVENVKHKVWLKVPLDDVEIVKGAATFSQKQLVDREQLEEDLVLMTQISDLNRKLKGPHQCLDDAVHEMLSQINKQLSEHQLKPPPPDACRVQLLATTHEGVTSLTVVFPSPEKKSSWESAFAEIKQKLATLSDGKPPEFLQALQITKTRAGMQFSCAAPIEGLNASQQRDVWVCNSDGYVGHMCLLSLQPEPIVTLNTPVPGCNSRILCICAVPAFHGCKRKGSQQRQSRVSQTPSTSPVTIHVESFDGGNDEGDDSLSDISSSTSDQGSDDDHDDSTLHIRTGIKTSSRSRSPSLSRSESGREGLLQDPYKSTMWLGTEDGCIHIFLCTDNIKTTKNKVKVQQNAGVLCIVHLDHKVFVSLDNGELVVYRRTQDGMWDMAVPDTVSIGSATSPVTKMLPVAGKLWCACQSNIIVLNPTTLCQEFQFAVSMESKRSIQCLASSGQGVWVAGQGSSKVLLYHATTYEHLLEVSISQAVAQKLQTADDIIRQHKTACLRITALLACKDLLWIGTSAGVVLTLVMPKVSAGTTRTSLTQPTVTGLVHGHTGHVRFLTSVEMPSSSKLAGGMDPSHVAAHMARRPSVSLHMLTMATRMLVISGGDGYEDFRSSSSNEAAGRDDSTNHLLLWQV